MSRSRPCIVLYKYILGHASKYTVHPVLEYCCCCAQQQVYNDGIGIYLVRDTMLGFADCNDFCSSTIYAASPINWMLCCSSGSNCNNLVIPSSVTSPSTMEQCYLGASPSECSGTLRNPPARLSRFVAVAFCCCFCQISSAAPLCSAQRKVREHNCFSICVHD